MQKPNLLFAIDVSGTPYSDTIIGCISFNLLDSPQVLQDFNKTFLKYKNKKGKDLDHNQLKHILSFLDEHKIRSNSLYLTSNDWTYILSLIPGQKAYKKEKIFGILYYLVLEWNTKPMYPYLVNVCEESFMKTDIAISTCRTIAKMRGKEYHFSKGTGKINDYIRIADFIASSVRKIKNKDLESFRYCCQVKKLKVPQEYIAKVFD